MHQTDTVFYMYTGHVHKAKGVGPRGVVGRAGVGAVVGKKKQDEVMDV